MPENTPSTTTIIPTLTPIPVTTTTTATTMVPVPEPWWPHMTFEAGGLMAGLIAVVVWVEQRIEKRRREDKERDKLEHDAIMSKVADNNNKVGTLSSRVDAMSLTREKDIERIVKLETNQLNFEKGQDEIKREMRDGFKELPKIILDAIHSRLEVTDQRIENIVESVREVRSVSKKD